MAKPLPENNEIQVPNEVLTSKIYIFRDQKVIQDSDLAELYEVQTFRLNERIKRNINRFPDLKDATKKPRLRTQ